MRSRLNIDGLAIGNIAARFHGVVHEVSRSVFMAAKRSMVYQLFDKSDLLGKRVVNSEENSRLLCRGQAAPAWS